MSDVELATGLLPGVLDSIEEGVMALDNERRILFMNRRFARMVGVPRSEWIGRPVEELRPYFESHLPSADPLAGDEGEPNRGIRHAVELEWLAEGGLVNLRSESSPLFQEGQIAGRVYVFRDVSREKEIDRMKSEFIAVASHEMRTPMTSIKGSVDLILSGVAGEISQDARDLLEISKKSVDRLIRMINEILDISKIEAGQIQLELVEADLTESVERSIRGLRSLADHTGVGLRLVRPDALPRVEVDRDRIEQVVTNLLSNAIRFSPPQSEVRIELGCENGWVTCAVVDQGAGIAPEDLPRVFGKFQQVGDQRKGGTGLGLAITQAYVNEHRGKIWAESRVGEGSRFIFALKAAQVGPLAQQEG
jgi:PAS domain S-box-containing protein